jgi:hypothetical protein
MRIRITGPHATQPVRPLHRAERELLACFGAAVDLERVRVVTSFSRWGRLVTRISRGAAVTLGYRIYLPGESRLALLAHELTHVSQYQAWGRLRYYLAAFWNQFVLRGMLGRDVYAWEAQSGKPFTEFGMEQQCQIVEDCFNVASPRRTEAQQLSPFVPVPALQHAEARSQAHSGSSGR